MLWGGVAVTRAALPTQASGEPIDELLVEVRALRIAMERLATGTPRTQLLTSRLTIQEERANRAERNLTRSAPRSRTGAPNCRPSARRRGSPRQADPRQQEDLGRQKEMIATRVEAPRAREQALRTREAEAANTLALEQSRSDELSDRLDTLERTLEAGQRRE